MKTSIVIILVVIAVLLVAGITLLVSNTNKQPKTNEENNPLTRADSEANSIEISDFIFLPLELKIKQGGTITWTNKDKAGHTITSDSGSELNSELLSQGQTYSHVFNTKGTFEYHCTPHPYMKAKVIVE